MKAQRSLLQAITLILFAIWLAPAASASNCFPCITVDEMGNGAIDLSNGGAVLTMPFGLLADPGPGGLASALTYDLMHPPAVISGDVFLHEADGSLSDLIRFNQSDSAGYPFALVFYSDGSGGVDSMADISAPPSMFYPNVIHIAEIGDGTNSGAFYTPGPFDPGFIPGFNVRYTFISDGTGPTPVTPEPSSFMLFTAGVLGVMTGVRRSR